MVSVDGLGKPKAIEENPLQKRRPVGMSYPMGEQPL
jgi:hypothetical protein